MKGIRRRRTIVCVVCLSILAIPAKSRADRIENDVIGVGVAIGAVGIAIGIGIFYAIHANNSVRGCTVTGSSGLELRQDNDTQLWILIGDTASIKPGDRVRVSGKKRKKNGTNTRQFLVEKLSKDYGACR